MEKIGAPGFEPGIFGSQIQRQGASYQQLHVFCIAENGRALQNDA
jgi:hypothetical protein